MPNERLKPAEAAAALGVPPSTLRLYSVRFAWVLSESAAAPVERSGGRPGYRLYSERDLVVLRAGKDLLGTGLTYEEALRELSRRWAHRAGRGRRPGAAEGGLPAMAAMSVAPDGMEAEGGSVRPDAEEPRSAVLPVRIQAGELAVNIGSEWRVFAAKLLAGLGSAQAVSEEWRRIVVERSQEINGLRSDVQALEEEIAGLRDEVERLEAERRRSWWRRVIGG